MKDKEWQILLDCVNMKEPEEIPIALIVDSPWIPGYLGIPHM
jgi:uroporphyrinogen decarboxylase